MRLPCHTHSPAGSLGRNSPPTGNIIVHKLSTAVIIKQLYCEVYILFYSRYAAAEDMHKNKSLKAQKGTLIMRQIEGLGVGLLAKTGSNLSQQYGKNRAF